MIGTRLTGTQVIPLTPSQITTIAGVRYFIAGIVIARKSLGEKKCNDRICSLGQVASTNQEFTIFFYIFWHARTLLMINSLNFKKTKRLQDLTAAVTASEKRRLHGHCQGSCTCPTGSVKANFNILHEVLGLVEKLAKRLQICYLRRRRSAHLVGRRRGPGPRKCTFFA